MPSVIAAGTTSNTALNFTADTTGVLQLQTNGTTAAMTINASQNVGIGTTTIGSGLSFGSRYVGNNGYANAIRLYDEGAASTSTTSNSYGFGFISDGILSYTAGTGGQHAWFTSNTERMRIDSSGNVGIGTNSPSSYGSKLAILANQNSQLFAFLRNDSSGSSSASAIALNAYGNTWGMEIGSAAKNNNSLTWQIDYGGTNAERLRLTTDGTLILRGGSTSATGTGIAFPATQSASSDANTLDDYEEGTWTPTYAGSASNPTVTYAVREGIYTKVGNLVTVSFFISASAASGGSGDIRITGFPFATVSTALRQGAGVVNYQNLSGATNAGALIYMDPSTATGVLQTFYCDSGVGISNLTSGTFNKNLSCTFTYRVA